MGGGGGAGARAGDPRRIPAALRFRPRRIPPTAGPATHPTSPCTTPAPRKREKTPQPPPRWALPPPPPLASETRRARGASAPGPARDRNSADDDRRPLRSPQRCLCFQPPHYPKFRSDRQGVCSRRFRVLPDQPHRGRRPAAAEHAHRRTERAASGPLAPPAAGSRLSSAPDGPAGAPSPHSSLKHEEPYPGGLISL